VVPTALPLLDQPRCALGEGPVWDAGRGVAHVVDIERGTLWEVALGERPSAVEVLRTDAPLGAAVPAEGGGFLLAAGDRLRHVDARGATVDEVVLVPPGVDSRLNDGKVDPAGRFLVGSMANDGRRGQERLWRIELDGTVTVLDDDLTLSNGLGWSPDGRTLYSVDTEPATIWARPYDVATGATGPRRRLLSIDEGNPDGMCVDATGHLWVAIWGYGQVRRLAPDGTVVEVVDVDAPITTSCAFVGPEMRTLLITTAGQPDDSVEQTATAGCLFTVDLDVPGLPSRAWRGAGPGPLGRRGSPPGPDPAGTPVP